MLEEIKNIINSYEEQLDKEYDNDQILMIKKINCTLSELKKELHTLLSAIPLDVDNNIIIRLKKILENN